MKRLALIAVCSILLSSCQGAKLVRVSLGGPPAEKPKIEKLVDLGSLHVPREGELDLTESDGMFVAGEWVAMVGTGLNTDQAKLLLDGKEVPIAAGIQGGGLLFRLPRDVKFRHAYTARVETPSGTDEITLPVTNLLVMGDPKGNRLLVWRTSPEEKKVFNDDSCSLACPGVGPFAHSPEGGVLYVVASGGKAEPEGLSRFELKTVHLGSKNVSKEVASTGFETRYPPISFAVAKGGSHGFLLTKGELAVFDLSDQERPKFVARQVLPVLSKDAAPGYGSLVLLAGGSAAVVLDEPNNRVLLIDLSVPSSPAVSGAFPTGPPAAASYSIAIAADPRNVDALWVLTGLNTQQVRQRLSDMWSDKPASPITTRAGLVRMELKQNTLVADGPVDLPEGAMPLGLMIEANGDVLVSAVAYEKETFAKSGLSFQGAWTFVKGVWGSLFAGRIYRVTPNGNVSVEVTSINMLLSMARIEGGPLVYSTYRWSMDYVPPSVNVVLAVDVLKSQRLPVRELQWKMILPPYAFFPEIMVL
ncbi:MAG: hypothetical protein A2X58_14695 [Nitrospirae bacterium GWC2_56_14]|nr:MAG: hypothetical protein A2X58_14695 [Nitrospirae bacterium GWC2_56_14]